MEDHTSASAPGLTATSPISLTASSNGNKSDDINTLGGRFLTVPGTKTQKTLVVPNGKNSIFMKIFVITKIVILLVIL